MTRDYSYRSVHDRWGGIQDIGDCLKGKTIQQISRLTTYEKFGGGCRA